MDKKFYVYVYLDPRKPGKYVYGEYGFAYEPFYVGEGSGGRCYNHLTPYRLQTDTNVTKTRLISKLIKLGYDLKNGFILKIKEQLSETDAKKIERHAIKTIGRRNLKLGPLWNLTDGGDGCWGMLVTDEVRAIISKTHKGKVMSPESRQKIKENNAKYWKGKSLPKKSLDKMRATKKEKPQDYSYECVAYIVTDPKGNEYMVNKGLEKFCKLYGLNRGHLVAVAKGQRKHNKHWVCRYK